MFFTGKKKVTIDDFFFDIFTRLFLQSYGEIFDDQGFQESEARDRFCTEFCIFRIWVFIFFVRFRKEFSNIKDLNKRLMINLVKAATPFTDKELRKDFYNLSITRFDEMDADMKTKDPSNVVIGLYSRIFQKSGLDSCKCFELAGEYWGGDVKNLSKIMDSIKFI
jgi:hypothetical protein